MRKNLIVLGTVAALAIPAGAATAQDEAPPTASQNAAKICKALRAQHGTATFNSMFGRNANDKNAFGKCVSGQRSESQKDRAAANEACTAERTADAAAFDEKYGVGKHNKNAFNRCVSAELKKARTAEVATYKNAAKECKAERSADAAAFAAEWGTKKNAFGKCVSKTARENEQEAAATPAA